MVIGNVMMTREGAVAQVSRIPTFFSLCHNFICIFVVFVFVFLLVLVFLSYFFFMIRGGAVARVPGMPTFFSLH